MSDKPHAERMRDIITQMFNNDNGTNSWVDKMLDRVSNYPEIVFCRDEGRPARGQEFLIGFTDKSAIRVIITPNKVVLGTGVWRDGSGQVH